MTSASPGLPAVTHAPLVDPAFRPVDGPADVVAGAEATVRIQRSVAR